MCLCPKSFKILGQSPSTVCSDSICLYLFIQFLQQFTAVDRPVIFPGDLLDKSSTGFWQVSSNLA